MGDIHFEKATLGHKDTIFKWLDKPHVREFWDNSLEHRADIEIFTKGRLEPTPYYDGIFDYWVGDHNKEPFCLLMTSELFPEPDLPPSWLPYLSKKGKSFSIDFMIGNEKFFGKGFAAPTLEAFIKFLNKEIDNTLDTFIIDPNENNPRAKHVYEKAGFRPVEEFMRQGEQFCLMVKKLNHK